jgi:hypothetical protein
VLLLRLHLQACLLLLLVAWLVLTPGGSKEQPQEDRRKQALNTTEHKWQVRIWLCREI